MCVQLGPPAGFNFKPCWENVNIDLIVCTEFFQSNMHKAYKNDLLFYVFLTSKALHDWKNSLCPLVSCDGCVDSWKISLPNALANSPNSC